jgi:hypothetical protein
MLPSGHESTQAVQLEAFALHSDVRSQVVPLWVSRVTSWTIARAPRTRYSYPQHPQQAERDTDMARIRARVDGTVLVASPTDGSPITVGTPAWLAWLETATSFAFAGTTAVASQHGLQLVPRWQQQHLLPMDRVLVPGGNGARQEVEHLPLELRPKVTLLENDQTPMYGFILTLQRPTTR